MYWPLPTFRVAAADRPNEPLTAKSCTGCWTQVHVAASAATDTDSNSLCKERSEGVLAAPVDPAVLFIHRASGDANALCSMCKLLRPRVSSRTGLEAHQRGD